MVSSEVAMRGRAIQGFFVGGVARLQDVRAHAGGFSALSGPPARFGGDTSRPAQAKPAPGHERGPSTAAIDPVRLGLVRGGGTALPQAVLAKMEAALATDFGAVRVHIGPQAPRIGALAFTVGNDIYFAPGRYRPESTLGQQLLGHELAHVVQQRRGRVPAPLAGVAIVQDAALEAEADRLGMRAAMHRPAIQLKPAQPAIVRAATRVPHGAIQRMNAPQGARPDPNTDNWMSDDLREERDALEVTRAELKHTLHHKTPRQLLGYFWSILTGAQRMTVQRVLDVPGRKGFLSMGSNLLLGPKPEQRSDEPGVQLISGENIALFDGNPTVSGMMTPRSALHGRAYQELLAIFQQRARAVADGRFHAILHLLEQAELIHYGQMNGRMLENPDACWTPNNAKVSVPDAQPVVPNGAIRDRRQQPTNWNRYASIRAGAESVGVRYSDPYSEIEQVHDVRSGHSNYFDRDGRQILTTRSTAFEFDSVPGKRSLRDQQLLHVQSLIPREEHRAAYDSFVRRAAPCSICQLETTLVCARCGQQRYCSKEHQRADWPRHKLTCVARS
jgi:hypothetical protein